MIIPPDRHSLWLTVGKFRPLKTENGSRTDLDYRPVFVDRTCFHRQIWR